MSVIKQPIVQVKPRSGNKSAQLVRSIFKARAGRKLPVSIGSVSTGADIITGEGFTMNKPHVFADLSPEDLEKIGRWLETAGAAVPVERPGFASLDAKLDRLLAMLESGQTPVPAPGPKLEEDVAPDSALDRLEIALADAMAEVAAQVNTHRAAGAKPSKIGHVNLTPVNASNPMDLLQARTNRVRFEVLPKFQRACQTLGLMKKGG